MTDDTISDDTFVCETMITTEAVLVFSKRRQLWIYLVALGKRLEIIHNQVEKDAKLLAKYMPDCDLSEEFVTWTPPTSITLPEWSAVEEAVRNTLHQYYVCAYENVRDWFPQERPDGLLRPLCSPLRFDRLLPDDKGIVLLYPVIGQPGVLCNNVLLNRPIAHVTVQPGPCQRHFAPGPDYSTVYVPTIHGKVFNLLVMSAHFLVKPFFCHPFEVIRRQLQVHPNPKRLYLTPFSLTPIVINLIERRWFEDYFKGFRGFLTCVFLLYVFEELVKAQLLHYYLMKCSRCRRYKRVDKWCHRFMDVLAKWSSWFLIAPFYASCVVMMVKADHLGEYTLYGKTIFRDVILCGLRRILPWRSPKEMLKVWSIVFPTAALSLYKHFAVAAFTAAFKRFYIARWRRQLNDADMNAAAAVPRTIGAETQLEYIVRMQSAVLYGNVFGQAMADALFFANEAMLHRCAVQGTYVAIDDFDTFNGLIRSLTVRHASYGEACATVLKTEGRLAVYRGFGVFALQYLCYFAFVYYARKWLLDKMVVKFRQKHPLPDPEELDYKTHPRLWFHHLAL